MPSANLELVRSIYAAWERGDFSSTEWAHPEIEWVTADGPTPGTRTGLAGMAESFPDFASVWKEYRVEADECRELDGERVLVLSRFSGRGKTSGLELGQVRANGASVFHVRDGKVTRGVFYWDRERALADLGLAPEIGPPVMASENVDLVRSIFAAWERGDWSSTEWAHPDIEFIRAEEGAPNRVKGLAGMAESWREFLSSWEDLRIENVEEYRELDGERVLVFHDFRGRGKTSGLELGGMRTRAASLFTFHDGKVTRLAAYTQRERALADLGLAPEAYAP